MSLRVLVTESEPRVADGAIDELVRAGHEVVRCHDAGAPAFPCAALQRDDECPLHTGAVDVALAVRRGAASRPTRSEDGALCALRHHVPLVVAGSTALDPFEPWQSAALVRTVDVVDVCERTAAAPLREHSTHAALAVRDSVVAHGRADLSFIVTARRQRDRIVVEVREPCPLEHALRNAIGVRIVAAVRAFDSTASGIDVVFSRPPV